MAEAMTPVILRCDCAHAFQDSVYGKSMRVHNTRPKDSKGLRKNPRCTVCGKEKAN